MVFCVAQSRPKDECRYYVFCARNISPLSGVIVINLSLLSLYCEKWKEEDDQRRATYLRVCAHCNWDSLQGAAWALPALDQWPLDQWWQWGGSPAVLSTYLNPGIDACVIYCTELWRLITASWLVDEPRRCIVNSSVAGYCCMARVDSELIRLLSAAAAAMCCLATWRLLWACFSLHWPRWNQGSDTRVRTQKNPVVFFWVHPPKKHTSTLT